MKNSRDTTILLKNLNLDIEDILLKIEKSLNIKFGKLELIHLETLEELIELIIEKVKLDNVSDCTSQQAFYKLRDIISEICDVNKENIYPDSPLSQFIKKRNYRSVIKKIENNLGFKINLFRPSLPISFISIGILIISLFIIYFDWRLGLAGIIVSIIGSWASYKFSNKLGIETISDIVKLMIREEYLKSRRKIDTFNSVELRKILNNWFLEECT